MGPTLMKTLILVVGVLAIVICAVVAVVFLRRSREETRPASRQTGEAHRESLPVAHRTISLSDTELVANPHAKQNITGKAHVGDVFDYPSGAYLCAAGKKLHLSHYGEGNPKPTLPLKYCDNPSACQCFLREIEDKRRAQRRVNRDRREQFRLEPGEPEKPDRRKLPDRRATQVYWQGYDKV